MKSHQRTKSGGKNYYGFDMANFWETLKNHLNETLRDDEKRRITILNEIKRAVTVRNPRVGSDPSYGFSVNTFDSYLNLLVKSGWLYKPRYGYYGLQEEIPTDLTLFDAESQAYPERMERVHGLYLHDKVLQKHGISPHEKKTEYFSKEEFVI